MKKLIWLILFVFLIPNVFATEYVNINVRAAYTNPYPVEPGKNLVLALEISNIGNDDAKNVIVELEPSFPFTLLEKSQKSLETLYPGNTRIVEYDLFIDSSAVSGVYKIPVKVSFDHNSFKQDVEVRVQGIPEFKLLGMKSQTISPGDQATISVEIANVGTGKAKRVSATFSSESEYIKPILGGGNVYIGEFKPEEKREIEFKILASSDSEYGVYTGTVTLTYEDESGNKSSTSFNVGILISGEPKFQIVKVSADSETNRLSVEISNTGTAEAKAITGKLIVNNKTFDVVYVTSVKIDKHTTLRFNLPNARAGKLMLSYEGPDNKKYSQTEIITWSFIPTRIPSWAWVLVIVVIGVAVWKRKTLLHIFKKKK